MSDLHLIQLRNSLELRKWNIEQELDGNGYDVSGYWVIARPDGNERFTLAFEGMDDNIVLPIDRSYACKMVENPGINLYFSKIHGRWKEDLEQFLDSIE